MIRLPVSLVSLFLVFHCFSSDFRLIDDIDV